MRKFVLFVFAIFFTFPIVAQYIENKIDLGVGVSLVKSVNAESYTSGAIEEESLFGNYSMGIGTLGSIEYHLFRQIHVGYSFELHKFNNWFGNEASFGLYDPTSLFSLHKPFLAWYPQLFISPNESYRWAVILGPVFSKHKLSYSEFDNILIDPEVLSAYENSTGFFAGICFRYELNYFAGLKSQLYYQSVADNNDLIADNALQGINLDISLYLKLFHNRKYNYD